MSARPATVRYRLRMFARRHRVGTVAGALLLVAIVGGVGGVLWQANVAAHERDRANAVKDYLIEVFSAADPAYESGEMLTAGELVERGAARVSSAFQDDPEIRAEITRVLGTVLMNLAQYERADEMLTLALEHHRRLDDPSGRYEALVGLGESAQWQGNLDAALDRYSEAGRLARHEFGAEDPRTLRALLVEASTLVEMGRADEAGQRFREAAERADRVLGVGTAEMASFHLARATYLHAIGDLEGVEREARAAAATYRRAGVGGLPLSRAYSALGRALGDLDRDDEGEEMLREAVAVLRAEYGDAGHPELAVALHNLAGPLMQGSLAEASGTGRLAEAEACMLEAIDVLERTVGPESWRVGEVLCSFSVVKTKQGDVAAAGELLAESIRITRAAFGDRHPAIAAPLSNLARNFLRQERYEDAAVAYEEAIAVARECFGERHLNVSHPLTGLADLCLETGRLAEAEAAAIEGWEIRRDALGARHSLVVETRVQIAGILEAADRGREALETLDGAVADARAGLPDTRTVLASALVARARQARELDAPGPRTDADLREALTIREREYGGDDARCGEIRDLLVSGPMR